MYHDVNDRWDRSTKQSSSSSPPSSWRMLGTKLAPIAPGPSPGALFRRPSSARSASCRRRFRYCVDTAVDTMLRTEGEEDNMAGALSWWVECFRWWCFLTAREEPAEGDRPCATAGMGTAAAEKDVDEVVELGPAPKVDEDGRRGMAGSEERGAGLGSGSARRVGLVGVEGAEDGRIGGGEDLIRCMPVVDLGGWVRGTRASMRGVRGTTRTGTKT